jgi:hypothetical protein
MARCVRRACVLAGLFGLLMGGCPAPPEPAGGDPANPGGGADGGGGGNPGGSGAGGGVGSPSNPAGAGNNAPTAVASASPSSGVAAGAEVTLDASGSSDPDGDALSFTWSQTAGPEVVFSDASAAVTTFSAPLVVENTELSFSVAVDDGNGGQASASVSVVIEVAGQFAGHPQGVTAYRDSLTSEEAYHLLRRIAFGATPDQVEWVVRNGLAKTVDTYLTYREPSSTLRQLADSYESDMPRRWMVHLMQGPNPLYERMAMFWHDRFATSRRVLNGGQGSLAIRHWEMLRRNGLGNYHEFLSDLTLDPLMLIWLNAADSPKDAPNENYTREFWELFTLGRDVLYTEADIKAGALAFTGISLIFPNGEEPRPVFDIFNHDNSVKEIFPGRAAAENYDYRSIIDVTLSQPEAAEYVARNLFVFFVHDHPSEAVVRELADGFVESGFEIMPLVRAILMSQALFSPDAQGNQISSPVEHFVGVARTLDMRMFSEDSQGYVLDRVTDDLAAAGHDLLNPPGVEGWGEDAAWLQDQWVLSRVRALGRTMEYGPDNTPGLPYHLLPDPATWTDRDTRREIVVAVASVFHLDLTEDEIDIYTEVLDQNGYLAFHLADAEQQPRHVFEMIRLMAMDERVIGR